MRQQQTHASFLASGRETRSDVQALELKVSVSLISVQGVPLGIYFVILEFLAQELLRFLLPVEEHACTLL